MTSSLTARSQPGKRACDRVLRSFLVVVSLLSVCSLALASEERASSLEQIVWQYMTSPANEQAAELLDDLTRRDGATVSVVASILRGGPSYGAQPSGVHPSVPLTLRQGRFSYALYVPESYQQDRTYGLVICLHGAGFMGEAYLDRWQARLGDRYILACPSYSMGAWWTRPAEELVLATMRDVMARYSVDPDRVFLTGMSNGGIGAWIIGMHHADLFAGLAPMASGIDRVLFPFLPNLRSTPAYVIHGVKDQVMPVDLSRTITDELKRLGQDVLYREHDREHPMAGGHYFPKEELPELVAWFDRQRRTSLPKSVTLVRDATHLSPLNWARIDSTDRVAAFAENLVEGKDEFIRNMVYARLDATIAGPNRIEATTTRVRRLSLFLTEELIDLSQPVTVVTNGVVAYAGPVTPSVATLLREARARHDWRRLFPVHLTVAVPQGP